ncbi:hypothetical protein IE53DRAFT_380607 [Violaceomyces palustris]|uniref:Uncharacterized protein n=1 Tax=Violaceomyces palustris TaxID=1673888 RepID=A0ACD0NU50_9BASI|nr:hypothetical protein IE53DRAFT_380607 [Violaceomyces palustris]
MPQVDPPPSPSPQPPNPSHHHPSSSSTSTSSTKRRRLQLSLRNPNYPPYSRPTDSPKFVQTLVDFDRFLRSLPLPLHRLVPTFVARAICRAFRTQNLMASNIAFDIALLFWRIIINLFFREIRPRSSWRIPREGPVIFVAAPHHNQFLDPLLLASEVRRGSGRRVAFLIAEKSIKRRFIGAAARIMQSIPVARAADSAKPGQGTVSLKSTENGLILLGHGSLFKSQLVPKGQIMLPKSTGSATAEVVEVISDTEVKIKKEFKDQRAIDALKGTTAEGSPGTKYQVLPFVDQTEMYASVYERLAEGGCLGIFPEGGSHDRTDLLPLKAGVVIMALGAMSANPDLNVRIVPVGMSYFHPHKFRSRAVVEFGAPINVSRELVKLFEEGGEGKRKAVGEMMDIVYDGLKGVTLRAPDYETLMVVQAGRRLYKAPGQNVSLGKTVELNRKFIMGYLKFKDEPRVIKLREDILLYNKKLRYAGLRDHQVERATRAGWRSLGLFGYRVGLLAFWGGLSLPGAILNSPIIILAKVISHRKAKEALAASQVKLQGRDVLATWKVLVSLGVAPILYSFYAAIATYLAHRYNLPPRHQLLMPLYALTILPTMSYSALKFAEVGIDIYKSLPPLFVSLLPGNHKVILDLQRTRVQISKDLHTLIDEFGPQVWDDFEETRMPPASDAPPATEREALIWKQKRKGSSDSTAMLTHPLTWVDERLFGWGRRRRGSSTRRLLTQEALRSSGLDAATTEGGKVGTASAGSILGGSTVNGDDSDDYSSATEGTEEEDEGDYETVFSMLNPHNYLFGRGANSPNASGRRSRSHSRSRSRSGSQGETFAEKRTRSNQDLRALMREGGAMSPTEQKPNFITKSNPIQSNSGKPPHAALVAHSTSTEPNPTTNASTTVQRRNRSHSLTENVHSEDLKNAGPKSRILPFSAASAAFEAQVQDLNDDEDDEDDDGDRPKAKVARHLENMISADPTPPATPKNEKGKPPFA